MRTIIGYNARNKVTLELLFSKKKKKNSLYTGYPVISTIFVTLT